MLAHAAAGGGLASFSALFPLLWLAAGMVFIIFAFNDKQGQEQESGKSPTTGLRKLPLPQDHPLRQVHVALAASRRAARARQAAGDGKAGPGRGARTAPPGWQRTRAHLKRVV